MLVQALGSTSAQVLVVESVQVLELVLVLAPVVVWVLGLALVLELVQAWAQEKE